LFGLGKWKIKPLMSYYDKAINAQRSGNTVEALRLLESGCEQGELLAKEMLAVMFVRGEQDSIGTARARDLLNECINQGQMRDHYYLAYLELLNNNQEEYLTHLRKAAEAGFEPAMARMGAEYDSGSYLSRNRDNALHWLNKAVDAGHVGARICRARILLSGHLGLRGFLKGIADFFDAAFQAVSKDVEPHLAEM